MSARRLTVGVGVILLAGAYLGGYWPERQRRIAAEAARTTVEARVADLEARDRIGALLGQLLSLTEAVAAMNYGQAQELSSSFFDRVQRELAGDPDSPYATALTQIAGERDGVTAALARGDSRALEPLREALLRLREALGYPPPPPGAGALPAGRPGGPPGPGAASPAPPPGGDDQPSTAPR